MLPARPSDSSPLTAWSDETLFAAVQQGDRQAFAEIYNRYWAELYQVACRKTGVAEVAEELVQDLFVTIWQRRERLNVSQLNRYLFSALKFDIIDYFREQAVHERFVQHMEQTATELDQRTEDSLAMQDLTRSVELVLGTLPDKTQQVFRLSRFECLTIPEIAVRLDVSEKTVQYHLGNALKALRTHLHSPDAWLLVLLGYMVA